VSCVANLSNLTGNERDKIRGLASSGALKKSQTGKRLLHFIMAEKPFFEPRIQLLDLKLMKYRTNNGQCPFNVRYLAIGQSRRLAGFGREPTVS